MQKQALLRKMTHTQQFAKKRFTLWSFNIKTKKPRCNYPESSLNIALLENIFPTQRHVPQHMLHNIICSTDHTVSTCIPYASLLPRQHSSYHNKFLKMTVRIKSCSDFTHSNCSYWSNEHLTSFPPHPSPPRSVSCLLPCPPANKHGLQKNHTELCNKGVGTPLCTYLGTHNIERIKAKNS